MFDAERSYRADSPPVGSAAALRTPRSVPLPNLGNTASLGPSESVPRSAPDLRVSRNATEGIVHHGIVRTLSRLYTEMKGERTLLMSRDTLLLQPSPRVQLSAGDGMRRPCVAQTMNDHSNTRLPAEPLPCRWQSEDPAFWKECK